MRFARVFCALIVAVLPLALLGAAAPPARAPDNAVIIYNPGNGDFTGFRIVVDRSGNAWANDGAGNEAGQLPPYLTQALFADLAAVPVSQQPARACPTSQPGIGGTSVWFNAGLNVNPNATRTSGADCVADPHIAKLFGDVVQIQRVLFVNAYRSRSLGGSAPAAIGATGTSYGVTSTYVGVNAQPSAGASYPTSYTARSIVTYGAGSVDSATFGNFGVASLANGRIASEALHLEKFANSSGELRSEFSATRFSNGGFSGGERFTTGGSFNSGGRFSQGMSLTTESRFDSGFRSGGLSGLSNTFGSGSCVCSCNCGTGGY